MPAPTITAMQESNALNEVLAWLATEQAATSTEQLAGLRHALEILGGLAVKPLQRFKMLDLFQWHAIRLQELLATELNAATLPLPAALRQSADLLVDAFGFLAQDFLALLRVTPKSSQRGHHRNAAQLVWQAMQCRHRQLQVCALVSAPTPAGLWQRGLETLRLAATNGSDNSPPVDEFKRMLALGVAQPESFSPRELAFLIDYLQAANPPITWVVPHAPAPPDAYWLDQARDLPPRALARRRPSPDESTLFIFDCSPLARLARTHLHQLDAGVAPATLGLPPTAASEMYHHALASAASRWGSPAKRQHVRRSGNYRVEVCAHAGMLWRLLGGGGQADSGTTSVQAASDWLVINESPTGYAMMHITGACAGLSTGTALGLRQTRLDAWRVCLVRWAKSENPEHVELGLELVAPAAKAVRLAYRGSAAPLQALLLPALPALQRGEALLTARGKFSPGAFTLLTDDAAGIRLFDCEAGYLTTRTSSIEIFEFKRQSTLDVI